MPVCHQYDVCKNYVGSVYAGGHGGPSESGHRVLRQPCPVSLPVAGESPSVPLQSAAMSYVNCGNYGQVV